MKKTLFFLTTLCTFTILIGCASSQKTQDEQKSEAPAEISETFQNSEEDNSEQIEETIIISETELNEQMLLEDFEMGLYWEPVGSSWNDGDCSKSCELSSEWGTEGETSLKCFITANGAEFEKSGFFSIPYETDWSGMKYILLDVFNPNDFDISICPVLQDGENWEEWNQCDAQICEANSEKTLIFKIPSLKYLSYVQRITIYEFGAVPQDCCFYFDNYRIAN